MWKTTKGLRLPIICNAVSGTLQVGASLSFIWVSKHLVDMATGQAEGSFVLHAVLMVSCVIIQLSFSAATRRIETRTEMRMANRMRQRLFSHVMISRWMGRDSMHTGDMLNRMEEDVAAVANLLCRTLPSVWVTLVRLTAAFVFLLVLDIRLAVILVFIMPLALSGSKRYVRRMRFLSKEIRATDSRVQTHMQENLQHRTLISTLERTGDVVGVLDALQSDLYRQVSRRTDFSIFSRTVVQFGFAAGYTTAFLWGVSGLWHGTVTFGMVTAFLQLVNQVQRPVVELGNQLPVFVHAFIAVDRLEELAALETEQQGAPVKLKSIPGVRLEKVSFTYPDGGRTVIDGFSHDFRPASLTAVIGETGVGKSTLMRLLLALLLPDKGQIVFYDRDSEVIASPRTRCNIIYVPQGNTLLNGTIRDNLRLGNPDATETELWRALHLSAADFVHELPDGLDTVCGELGTGLSEGQAQRIAIARGLLRPGGIVLLDEPTSSLDSETERTLLKRLAEQVHDKTLILVTHKETAARFCTYTVTLTNNV